MADSAWIQAEGYLRVQEESDLVSDKRVQIEQLLFTYIYTVIICVFHTAFCAQKSGQTDMGVCIHTPLSYRLLSLDCVLQVYLFLSPLQVDLP